MRIKNGHETSEANTTRHGVRGLIIRQAIGKIISPQFVGNLFTDTSHARAEQAVSCFFGKPFLSGDLLSQYP